MLSFWEKQSFLEYDHIIIGSGIVGLSTAVSIKEIKPESSILILERGVLPTGASTKNAGFACFGTLTEILTDIQKIGEAAALQLVENRWTGLQKLRKRLGNHNIDFQNYGGYELLCEHDLNALDSLEVANAILFPVFKEKVFQIAHEKIRAFKLNSDQIKGLIYCPQEGQIDTGKMMKALLNKAREMGIAIYTGAEVNSVEEGGPSVKVYVHHDHLKETIAFKTSRLAICTNAFTHRFVPDLELNPGRGQVMITKPINNLRLIGAFHLEEGFYYFRNIGNRLILGGGRNLDLEKEQTTEFAYNDSILNELEHKLKNIILPETRFEIEDRWTGIMAFGPDKRPVLKRYSDKVVVGVRLGGTGIAIGSNMGEQLAEMMVG